MKDISFKIKIPDERQYCLSDFILIKLQPRPLLHETVTKQNIMLIIILQVDTHILQKIFA